MKTVLAKDTEIGKIYRSKSLRYILEIKSKNRQGNSHQGEIVSVTVINLSSETKRELNISPDTELFLEEFVGKELEFNLQSTKEIVQVKKEEKEEENKVSQDLGREEFEVGNQQIDKQILVEDVMKKTNTEKASKTEKKSKIEKVSKEKKVTRASIIDFELTKLDKNEEPDFDAIAKLTVKAGAATAEDHAKVVSQAKVRYKWYKEGLKKNPAVK